MANSATTVLRELASESSSSPLPEPAAEPAKPIKKPGKPASSARMSKIIPTVGELRLAPEGVTAHGERYVNIAFTNGFQIRLFPVNFNREQTRQVRDLTVAWLAKRLRQ